MTSAPEEPGAATAGRDLSGSDVLSGEEALRRQVAQLERLLSRTRRFSVRTAKDLHRSMLGDLRAAEQRARKAEKRATEAEQRLARAQRRARRAEAELAELRDSATWRAGRAVVAVPARIKRWRR